MKSNAQNRMVMSRSRATAMTNMMVLANFTRGSKV